MLIDQNVYHCINVILCGMFYTRYRGLSNLKVLRKRASGYSPGPPQPNRTARGYHPVIPWCLLISIAGYLRHYGWEGALLNLVSVLEEYHIAMESFDPEGQGTHFYDSSGRYVDMCPVVGNMFQILDWIIVPYFRYVNLLRMGGRLLEVVGDVLVVVGYGIHRYIAAGCFVSTFELICPSYTPATG